MGWTDGTDDGTVDIVGRFDVVGENVGGGTVVKIFDDSIIGIKVGVGLDE